jgi:hypothetical protein
MTQKFYYILTIFAGYDKIILYIIGKKADFLLGAA